MVKRKLLLFQERYSSPSPKKSSVWKSFFLCLLNQSCGLPFKSSLVFFLSSRLSSRAYASGVFLFFTFTSSPFGGKRLINRIIRVKIVCFEFVLKFAVNN